MSLGHNQCPPMLAGQSFLMLLHLCTCDGGVHHCIAFLALVMAECIVWVGRSATQAKSYIHCCNFAEINQFLYDFAVGRWVADPLVTVDDMSLPPAIGPTLGANFQLLWVFKLSPLEGVASHALGLWQQTETKAMDVDK